MAFNPYLYTEARGASLEWDGSRIQHPGDWDPAALLCLFGVPDWSIDAELILMNWGRDGTA